jgi:hypothetical protein|nr:MAG TPA: hypothetical protein [Caudoviricetes sp.]
MEFRTFSFTGPSGYQYEIREQNGADEDILSNLSDMKNLMNITKFISAIVVKTDVTPTGKLTVEDALSLPVNDRYCIIFQSRIFSLGEEVEFEYDWGKENGGKVTYGQDLNEFLFDFSDSPNEEEMDKKPDAIPFYPYGKRLKDHEVTLDSGKLIKFDCMNGHGEQKLVSMPLDKQTKNAPLLCRNLCLEVDGKWEVVENFAIFTAKDMAQIRKQVASIDPIFKGESHITNPVTGEERTYPIIWAPSFFYLTEE